MTTHDHAVGHSEHVVPIRVYVLTFLALLVLLFLTVETAYWHPPSYIGIFIMLAIATIKTTLVILYFMHVRWASKLTWVYAGIGFVFLLILFGVVMDYASRHSVPITAGWYEAPP